MVHKPAFMAYELQLLWHMNPDFYAIWAVFIIGVGVVFNLLRVGWKGGHPSERVQVFVPVWLVITAVWGCKFDPAEAWPRFSQFGYTKSDCPWSTRHVCRLCMKKHSSCIVSFSWRCRRTHTHPCTQKKCQQHTWARIYPWPLFQLLILGLRTCSRSLGIQGPLHRPPSRAILNPEQMAWQPFHMNTLFFEAPFRLSLSLDVYFIISSLCDLLPVFMRFLSHSLIQHGLSHRPWSVKEATAKRRALPSRVTKAYLSSRWPNLRIEHANVVLAYMRVRSSFSNFKFQCLGAQKAPKRMLNRAQHTIGNEIVPKLIKEGRNSDTVTRNLTLCCNRNSN